MTQKVPLSLVDFNGSQLAGMRNRIINGKMEIAQRGTTFTAAASGTYTVDRWIYLHSSAAVITASRQSDGPSSDIFRSLRVAVTTADASIAAGDTSAIAQRIEGYNASSLRGKTFTLSFWVRSAKTGVHCVSFRNAGFDRSYVAEYTVSVANTWEFKTCVVTGGLITAGTWNNEEGAGLEVAWLLASGSTFHTTPNTWQTGNFLATSSQVNCLDTIGNIFAITGVQLEAGDVATSFEHRLYGVELALCQRYYETGSIVFCTSATPFRFPTIYWKVSKRASPTLTIIANGGSGATITHLSSATGALEGAYQNAGNSVDTNGAVSANAEL